MPLTAPRAMVARAFAWVAFIQASFFVCSALASGSARSQTSERVVDIPTRPGVTQRFLYIAPAQPKAAVILLTGGPGILQIFPGGTMGRGKGNFLVRSRQLFADAGFAVAVVDAPSDHQTAPFLSGFRQTSEHASDLKAVVAWLRQQQTAPVWLVGTSRGTQSAAFVATELNPAQGGPDGVVLTSTILTDQRSRAVPQMPLEKIKVPVLVVHHEQDGCRSCAFSGIPYLMDKLATTPKSELITFTGGLNEGDPCEAMAYHGFNGIEGAVVGKISSWMLAH